MSQNIVYMKHDEVDALFKQKLGSNVNESLLEALYDFLPQISAYKEEDKTFSFKIAIGENFREKIRLGDGFYKIATYDIKNDKHDCSEIKKILKQIAIFCAKNADLYINLLNDEKIEFGVYFVELEQTGVLERQLLISKAVLLEGFSYEGIRMLSFDGNYYNSSFIRTSFTKEFNDKKYNEAPSHWSNECQYWDGVFRKVRQTVHGTMCLIVRPEWKENDDNFIGNKATDFEGVSIAYERTNDAKRVFALQNSIELFISMLDFDGITVLDTTGKIRSYHNIVDNTKNQNDIPGGARHKAYASLKNTIDWETRGYVGIYFQSHEGEIKFHEFSSGEEYDYFKSEVMNCGSDEPLFSELKKYYYEGRYDSVVNSYYNFGCQNYQIYCDIEALEKAHLGWDNFSNEIQPANQLNQHLSATGVSINTVAEYPGALRKLINTLIMSYVGNRYGNSDGAASYVEAILKTISKDMWNSYLQEKDFIYGKLIQDISYFSDSQRTRWKLLENIITATGCNVPEEFAFDNFYWRTRAYNHIRDVIMGYEKGDIPDKSKNIEY